MRTQSYAVRSPASVRSAPARVRIGGVVLNRVGSDRHEAILREALGAAGVPVLGAVRRIESLSTPSRHLGLVPVAEGFAEEARIQGGLVGSPNQVEAITAYFEKRDPVFRDRD